MDLKELQQIANKENLSAKEIAINCCTAAGCQAANSQQIKKKLDHAVKAKGLENTIEVHSVGCLGLCGKGPLLHVEPNNTLYQQVTPQQAESIIDAVMGGTTEVEQFDFNHPFFANQLPIATENCGRIDPERIESYIAVGGYQQLYNVLYHLTPANVV
jgi:bidirectional [NiFe] hydrogenase diaphorase subunit